MKFSHLLALALLALALSPVAAHPLAAQELSEEAIQAILEGREAELGRTRTTVAEPRAAEKASPEAATPRPATPRAATPNPAGVAIPAVDPTSTDPAALFRSVTEAAAASGAPMDMGEITGVAKQLLGASLNAEGAPELGFFGKLGQTMTEKVLDTAADQAAGRGGVSLPLPGLGGGGAGLLGQVGSMMMGAAAGGASGPSQSVAPAQAAPPTNATLENAQALLDAYNASQAAAAAAAAQATVATPAEPEPVAEPEEASTRRTFTRPAPRPSRSRMDEDEGDEEREALPWQSRARGGSDDEDAPPVQSRARLTGSRPRTVTRAASEPVVEPAPEAGGEPEEAAPARRAPARAVTPTEEPAPEGYQDLFDGVPTYEEAIAEREGDWFVVLGSYRIHAGADPLPSPDVDGSAQPAESTWIAGAQERLWDAGYVPYVVRSDALPGFAEGLAVIVVGPLTQREAAAEIPTLRGIVPDAYIKAGW